ncbi:hypothetical protein GCM10009085_49880 [Pseudomonas avellanae]|nr:hypothetical protein GCM10009085_49880 [Pseudomonas avellanae]
MIVDSDNVVLTGKAFDDARVEIVQYRAPMVEQDDRYAAAHT